MLVNDLLKFHKNKLSSWNLIFKYFKKTLFFLILLVFLLTIGMFYSLFTEKFIWAIGFFLIYILILFYLNKKMKEVILKKHNIDMKVELEWDVWKLYKVEKIKVFLKNKGKLDGDTIQALQKYVEKEAKNAKPSNYLIWGVPGLMIATGVPIWNHFNSWYFSNVIESLENAIIYLLMVIILISLISFILGSVIKIINVLEESNYRRLNELSNFLELVYLIKDDGIENEEIDENL